MQNGSDSGILTKDVLEYIPNQIILLSGSELMKQNMAVLLNKIAIKVTKFYNFFRFCFVSTNAVTLAEK